MIGLDEVAKDKKKGFRDERHCSKVYHFTKW